MKKISVLLCLFIILGFGTGITYAELTKSDIEEIRMIVREEFQRLDKRIDELRGEIGNVRSEIEGVRSEIGDVRGEIEGVRSEIMDVRSEIRDARKEMKDFLLWGFGVTFAGIFALIGFVLWDRRTALAPAIRKNKELEEREEKVERILKEYAMKEPKMAEVLKQMGLL